MTGDRRGAAENRPAGGTFWGSALGLLILLVLAAGFGLTSATIARFTGADYADADRRGTATVRQCERRGPITLSGFGYFDRCVVDIEWNDGAGPRVVIDDPGFMRGEKPGDTFEIGLNYRSRGSITYSRPEVPDRGWVTWAAVAAGVLSFLCAAGIYLFVKQTIRDLRARLAKSR